MHLTDIALEVEKFPQAIHHGHNAGRARINGTADEIGSEYRVVKSGHR